jgi:hypothetical protein
MDFLQHKSEEIGWAKEEKPLVTGLTEPGIGDFFAKGVPGEADYSFQ